MDERKLQGERLKMARKELGLRQNEAASILDVHTGSYSDIENGRNKLSNEMAYKVRTKLGISVDWVLTGKGKWKIGESEMAKEADPPPYNKMDFLSEFSAFKEHYIDFVSKLKDKSREEILEEIEALAKKKNTNP